MTIPVAAVFSLLIALATCSSAARDAATARPNLIAVMTDDQGRWAMGAYGNKQIQTPNMDRVAREGALFVNAFVVTPVCSPSRATYFAGRWPTELGITDYISPAESDAGLGIDAAIWPEALRQHGYRTALVGKWHLGTQSRFHPTQRGFDRFMGFLGGSSTPMDPLLEVQGRPKQLRGPLPDALVEDAIRFIEANRDRPFALCLHFRAPHLPYGPVPEVDRAPYASLDPKVPKPRGSNVAQIKQWTRDYYASITSVDRNLGRLLNVLDELGLSENTLVIFASDHGYNLGRHGIDTKGNGHWIAGGARGPKRPNMWDTSMRIPLAIRWPAVVKPGTRIDYPVTFLDMYRTITGALDVPIPPRAKPRGIDFSPLLRGQPLGARDALFGQYDLHNNGLAYMRMIRTANYKYVRHYKANMMDELYDLQQDPGEARNLLRGRQREVWKPTAEQLQQRLLQWQLSIDDPIPGGGN